MLKEAALRDPINHERRGFLRRAATALTAAGFAPAGFAETLADEGHLPDLGDAVGLAQYRATEQ